MLVKRGFREGIVEHRRLHDALHPLRGTLVLYFPLCTASPRRNPPTANSKASRATSTTPDMLKNPCTRVS
ncbi:uncharacterized protein CMC5_036550 [Chondromyces crocatus]|uniref:Uncharacterized protein n=1 Tax=Chondromyces crocatus TaxID=52 RepID=A0A0K1EFZ7_CHOCO|nr:uncharacterized protein CMC5_036550 [Chondromyces crocatus]